MVSIHEALKKAKREQLARRREQRPSLTIVPSQEEGAAEALHIRPEGQPLKSLDESLITYINPESPVACNFRSLGKVLAALGGRCRGRFGITSALRGEGRTTIATNLGLVWAEEPRERVLLMDADAGSPALASRFALPGEPGLSEILSGPAGGSIEEALLSAVRPSGVPRLDVLPFGGEAVPLAQLLASEWMQPLWEYLKRAYTRVILDLPPVATREDARAMSRVADGLLMVVRAGATDRRPVRRRLAWLASVRRESVVGCVLNGVEAKASLSHST
ncbi:MAG TPA: capsular biosynthesis protein [Firmicutes bacterium]|nr:capsular biosynthesis protein [Bacillota bacterium]